MNASYQTIAVNELKGEKPIHIEMTAEDIAAHQAEKAEIDAKVAEMLAEYDAQKYARDRATSYPSVGDQLDMLIKDMKNGTTTHQEACEAVKTKYPKP